MSIREQQLIFILIFVHYSVFSKIYNIVFEKILEVEKQKQSDFTDNKANIMSFFLTSRQKYAEKQCCHSQ